jgi:hypothetical protein
MLPGLALFSQHLTTVQGVGGLEEFTEKGYGQKLVQQRPVLPTSTVCATAVNCLACAPPPPDTYCCCCCCCRCGGCRWDRYPSAWQVGGHWR